MAIVDKLAYEDQTELMHNCQTSTPVPEHIMRLGHSPECPYCGARMRTVKHEVKDLWEGYGAENPYSILDEECQGCRWWRHREWPNHYFNGYWRIGVLRRTSHRAGEFFMARVNDLMSTQYKLYEMEPYEFESFVGNVLRELYDCTVLHVGMAGDGGIDLILVDSEMGQIPVQVKRRGRGGKVEGVAVVREMRGAMVLKNHSDGMIVTTADRFSVAARDAAEPKPGHLVPQNINLVDCRRLLDIMGLVRATYRRPEIAIP